MTIRRAATLTLIAVSIGSFTYATYAVTYAQRSSSEVPALTAADYVEIQQLVARYGFALDTGADNGYMLADMFAPGGSERDKKTPTEMDHFAHYEDEFVKTADGWRFKSRRTFNEGGSLRPASQRTPPATDSAPLR